MPRKGAETVYLITGFPSLGARKMAQHILAVEPDAFVYLVIVDRLSDQAAVYLDKLEPQARQRVHVLTGDAASMDLGLSGAELRMLASEVDFIHHMAHASYLGVSDRIAHNLNVRGAAEILELAGTISDLKALVFHSTAHVAGNRKGIVYEDELDCGQRFRNVVEETRMQGEMLVARARGSLPIVVVRPTTIVGDSGTGETDRFDGPYLLVLLIMNAPENVAIPLPARADAPIHFVPVDYVVRAAHALGKAPEALGRTFHLAERNPVVARAVFERIAGIVGRRAAARNLPPSLAKVLMKTPGVERFARSPRLLVEEMLANVRYDTRHADRLLKPLGIDCPVFDQYAEQLVATVQEHVRARKRPNEGTAPTPAESAS